MYKTLIKEAVQSGYKGLNYFRYNRDDFYYASNMIAMSDDYQKSKSKNSCDDEYEYYLGVKRKKRDDLKTTYCENENKELCQILELIGLQNLSDGTLGEKYHTLLNDIQGIYYVIGKIYEKTLNTISKDNPSYGIINKYPLTNCIINDEMIDNLSEEAKRQLTLSIKDLLTSHTEISTYYDNIIEQIKKACGFNSDYIKSISISSFVHNISLIKSQIEKTISTELFTYKNQIITTKNTINALLFLKENNPEKYTEYKEYDDKLRKELKCKLLSAYLFFYSNKEIFRLEEIISYFSDILLDPQTLMSRNSKEKSLCEELYEEILEDINNNKIEDINDKDDFKIFTTRVSAPSFCQYRLLYTYNNEKPLCRLEVYGDMIKRFFGEEKNTIINKTIEQIAETEKYTTYDSVICSEEYLKKYIDSMEMTPANIRKLVKIFNKIDYLEVLIDHIPEDYLEIIEEEIISQINNGNINGCFTNTNEMYKQLVKRNKAIMM